VLISAVICTHNRAALLRDAVKSLLAQSLDERSYEIIVVDNCSTDETVEVIAAEQRIAPSSRIRLIHEPQLGLGYARNAGWRQSRGTFVAYMDDDAKAEPTWLEQAVECFARHTPAPVAVGGPILPYYLTPKRSWFKDEYELRSWGDHERPLRRGESFSGSNMVFRRDVLESFGGFDCRVGMSGTRLSVGEERSLFERLAKASDGQLLYYSPDVIVYHAVPEVKMRPLYHLRRSFATGRDLYVLSGPTERQQCLRGLRHAMRAIREQSVAALRQFREFPDYRNWIVESVSLVALECGRFVQGLKACCSLSKTKAG
jgi:glycosyltransferase involved in cell wall biosynthesis